MGTIGFSWMVALGLLVGLLAEALSAGWLVRSGRFPVPHDWLDLRMSPWIVAHAACFGLAMLVGAAVALIAREEQRPRIWSPGAVAFAAVIPSLALAWMVIQLITALRARLPVLDAPDSPIEPAPVVAEDRLMSQPQRHSAVWTWLALVEVSVALLVVVALVWPDPWRPWLSPAAAAAIDWVRHSGLWLRWLLATIGLAHLIAAAFGWYWETFDEGALVTWLSPVVLLAPLLVFLSTALLTGLGRDVAGPQGMRLSHALRDSLILWGLLSLYGVYYLVTSWTAMRSFVVTAILGYALCGPMLISGWETGRIETHRLACGERLRTLAIGLRNYAETYGELPPAATRNDAGGPLLSWRVLVLPFIGHEELYRRFDLTAAWDAPQNRALLPFRPELFNCDELPWDDLESTLFVAPLGERTFFPPEGGVARQELSGYGAKSILLLETTDTDRVAWTSPHDPRLQDVLERGLRCNQGGKPMGVTAGGEMDDIRPARSVDGSEQPLETRFWRPSGFNR